MSVDIKNALDEFSQMCVPSDAPWERIRNRIAAKANTKSSVTSRYKKLVSAIVGAAVVVGGVLGGASVSPTIAVAMDKMPVANHIYDWFGDPGLNHAVAFDNKMHVSSVDRGITFTITDAYYDQGRLALQYQVSLPNRMIGSPAATPEMDFYIDGSKATLAGMGGTGRVSDTTWQGMYEILSTGLPKHFTLQIAIHKIGGVRGYWQIQVPVSEASTLVSTKTLTPNVSQTSNGTTITVKNITETPATIIVNYEYTSKAYSEKNPLGLKLYTSDGSKVPLRMVSNQVLSQHTISDSNSVEAVSMFAAPNMKLKELNIIPSVILTNQNRADLTVHVPLN